MGRMNSEVESMKEQMSNFGLVAFSGKLFAIGGSYRENTSKTVEIYCPDTDTWKFGASMQESRYGHAVAVLPRV